MPDPATVSIPRWWTAPARRESTADHPRVQLVRGENDPFFPVRCAQEMVATFPDARLRVISGTRLSSHEEKPAEVAAALLPVLVGSS